MLIELMDVPELNSFIVVKDNELNAIENPVTRVTVTEFHRYSTAILDYIKSKNIDSNFNYSAVNNQQLQQLRQSPKPFTRPNPSSVRLINVLPRGVTAAQHVEKWREHKLERSNNGNCSYCGSETYGIPTCWYLYLAKRYSKWIPRLGI